MVDNAIVISLDTLRARSLGCYGCPWPTSPHLDRVAAAGTRFVRCISPHIPTHPAHTTLLTGRDVFAHQVVSHAGRVEPPEGVQMLAEILAERGFYTGAADNLGRWFARGFADYRVYRWETDPTKPWRKAEAVNAEALAVLEKARASKQRFFVFLHYWDPHTPYLPPPPFDRMFYAGDEKDPACRSMEPVLSFPPFADYFRQWLDGVRDIEFPKAQYHAEIAYLDTCLAHVFTWLERHELADRTLVVITADHGEELDEHAMWFDHHGLYDTNVHVPLVLWCPGRVPAAVRGGLVRLLDVAPTVLDYLGLGERAQEASMEGVSLRPLVETGSDAGSCRAVYLTECTWMRKRGWRTREWKLIEALEPDIHGGPPLELYHLTEDPEEARNLAASRPEVVAALQEQMLGHVHDRLSRTGLPDPVQTQGITLRKVGPVRDAVPEDRQYARGGDG